ncbi:MAG: hypothetical protein Q9212_005576 [Teloschistes hypoglaucus]
MIRERSGKDFDNVSGPIVVCLALIVALCLNFGLKLGSIKLSSSETNENEEGINRPSSTMPPSPPKRTGHTPDIQAHMNVHGRRIPIDTRDPLIQEHWSRLWNALSSRTRHYPREIPMNSSSSDDNNASEVPSSISETTQLEDPISWPPKGLSDRSVLFFKEASVLIAKGAVCFEATFKAANHGGEHDVHLYPLLGFMNGPQVREATSPDAILADCMSYSLNGTTDSPEPWSTLEQPSMTLCFGRFPGTVTLTRYLGALNRQTASVDNTPKAMLHEVSFYQITDRLRYLQEVREAPFEMSEQEEDFLHSELISDLGPDETRGTLEQDIDALSSLLNSHIWIDFSDLRNQVVAQQFVNQTDPMGLEIFLHQMLLSAELDRRIRLQASIEGRGDNHVVPGSSRKVAWSVLLSRIFLRMVGFECCGFGSAGLIPTLLIDKTRQLDKIWDISDALHWPDMEEVKMHVQKESGGRAMRFGWSAPSLTFLLGITLPGPSASFSAMSCLVDCSPAYQETLAGLHEMRRQSGFQYLTNTYWQWESVVGKVLGAMEGPKCVAGWIGPCTFTPDLDAVQYVRIYQKRPAERMKNRDRKTIAQRSDPLGLRDTKYRVSDFVMVSPDLNKCVYDIEVEKLAFKIHKDPNTGEPADLLEHDVAVQFLINGASWPVRLRYDVSFIAAAACWSGPHVLAREYAYKSVCVQKLTTNFKWAGWDGVTDSPAGYPYEMDDDTVLLVETCAHMGLSAVVSDISITCLACAIREAYAACMAVVIVSNTSRYEATELEPHGIPTYLGHH